MKQNSAPRTLGKALVAVLAYLAIFIVGLQYSFYRIFSARFRWYDDEGTMMLKVRAFVEDPASYDSLSGIYGPFYYLHKYAIYSVLNTDVSHDINRLTTIVLWGLIAAGCAFFVHRVTRSVVLAAIVQMQLILHLSAFVAEPGHPHEIALVLIVAALVLSTFVNTSRSSFASMVGLGAVTGALILVKVNLGLYLSAPVALALLFFLPKNALVLGLRWLASATALTLPAAIMWRHLGTSWGRNYCALVTLLIAASLVASARRREGTELRWGRVGACAGGAVVAIGFVCAVIVGGGGSLYAIADAVVLRAATFSSSFFISAPVSQNVVFASTASFLIAVCYAFSIGQFRGREIPSLVLSVVKLGYGCFALYGAYHYPENLLLQTIPVPFLWLVVVETYADAKPSLSAQFPRVFLCFLAAFQTLQAYPVHGSQAQWSVFLVVPAAAVCLGDGIRSLFDCANRRIQWNFGERQSAWFQPTFALLLVCSIGITYYGKANLADLKVTYSQRTPLNGPGASRIRLLPFEADLIRWLVESLKSHCDGFVAMPGFSSLYFWTQIRSPAASMNSAWMLFLEEDTQRSIIETMQAYERPCVLHNPSGLKFWTMGQPVDSSKPLVRYIQTQYKPLRQHGGYTLLVRSDRPVNVEVVEDGT
jgi:hypothetical protein